MESRDLIFVLETHFCKSPSRKFQVSSRSRRLQVSRLWKLQRNGLLKFYILTIFCLLYLQVRNDENRSKKCQKFKNINSEVMTTLKKKFGKMYKFWSFDSRYQVSSLESQSRTFWWSLGLEVLTRSRRLRSWLHHCYICMFTGNTCSSVGLMCWCDGQEHGTCKIKQKEFANRKVQAVFIMMRLLCRIE